MNQYEESLKHAKIAADRKKVYEEKEKYHKEMAKLPFEEKIRILIELQKIATEFEKNKTKKP